MYEEVIPCEYSECDVYLLKPGKTQCSFEGTDKCKAGVEYKEKTMDKSKIAKMDMETFRQVKELEYRIELYQKMTADWKETAEALAISLGDVEIAQNVYEDIRDGLYDIVRERMIPNTNTQKSFDGLHDYATLICTKAGEAQELRVAAEDASDAENSYYWDGYEAALDFAIDSLPNYNN
jgi:hypothetical protein